VGFEAPEALGGIGVRDFRFNAILDEEMMYAAAVGDGFSMANDVVAPYLVDLATPEQQARWLPGFTSGRTIVAIAMTEPGAGSDLRGLRTTAKPTDGGYLLNGSKTFVTSGVLADLVIVAARTADHDGALSLFLVPADSPGFARGRKLSKVGRRGQDTGELFFTDLFVPDHDVLGERGRGLAHLKTNLPQERMSQAVMGVAACEKALELTIAYCQERHAFGQPIGSFQANRHVLADLATEVAAARALIDACILALTERSLSAEDAAGAKLFSTELQSRVLDRCVQLHGGYGYMDEYVISRLWRDGRVQRIYGGTSEIMREIIGRSLGL
jgi:alkylation response protein AidB-like acyl-CoA dehydrogenase